MAEEGPRRIFDDVEGAFGGRDIVIENAGLPFIGVTVVDVWEEGFDRVFALNATGGARV